MTNANAKKVLMVLTSHADLGNSGEKTGFWVEEFAAPYYTFVDAGIHITLASPAGGQRQSWLMLMQQIMTQCFIPADMVHCGI